MSEVGVVLDTIKSISDKGYQKQIWVKHENPNIVDSYDDTTMYFLEEAAPIIEDPSDMIMTSYQYKTLKKLYEMVDAYDSSQDRPQSDEEIVRDPKWDEIRNYAKQVYEELKE